MCLNHRPSRVRIETHAERVYVASRHGLNHRPSRVRIETEIPVKVVFTSTPSEPPPLTGAD